MHGEGNRGGVGRKTCFRPSRLVGKQNLHSASGWLERMPILQCPMVTGSMFARMRQAAALGRWITCTLRLNHKKKAIGNGRGRQI